MKTKMKLASALSAITLFFGLAGIAQATVVSWVDTVDPVPNIMIPPAHTVHHSILDDGFDPLNFAVTGVSLAVWLRDDCGFFCKFPDAAPEFVSFNWDGLNWVAEGELATFAWGEMFEFTPANSLLAGGTLDVMIRSDSYKCFFWTCTGDFYFDKSELTVTGVAVPEPGTLALLGLGLAGLGFAGSRRRAR